MADCTVTLEIGNSVFTLEAIGDIEVWCDEGTWRDSGSYYEVTRVSLYHARTGAPVSKVFQRFITKSQWEYIHEMLVDSFVS